MKCDSSLLNQKKPFFLPDWSEDIRYCRCRIARISRLGKCIEERFAQRYYDAVGYGLNFRAEDILQRNWAEGTAFDNSLCVGELMANGVGETARNAVSTEDEWTKGEWTNEDFAAINRAIHDVSEKVTLRNGDLVFIDYETVAEPVVRNQLIEDDHLYCKIK